MQSAYNQVEQLISRITDHAKAERGIKWKIISKEIRWHGKKPLSELTNEEIRLLIGQRLGLKYLLPMAIDILKADSMIEVTFFPGDLLRQLLELNDEDWIDNKEERDAFLRIAINNRSRIEENEDIPENCKNEMLELLSSIME